MSHAILSPSAASRWLACPPSARLEATFPDKTGDFAEEGSLAHELGEIRLKHYAGMLPKSEYDKAVADLRLNKYYTKDMEEYTDGYAVYAFEHYQQARKSTPDAVLRIEEQIDLTAYVPEGFGTGDAIIIADGTLEIIDLKYGKGVPVSAMQNKQMMLYALGALDMFGYLYAINRVRMTIYQPRLDNISEFEMSVNELTTWGKEVLKPTAAIAFRGEGDFVPGAHCRFCKAKAQCKALAGQSIKAAEHEFDNVELLSDDEVAKILSQADNIKSWINSVEEYALQAALDGKKFPGFKLVEGRSIRKYSDEDKVADVLTANGFKKESIYEKPKLKTITNMEKLITKKTFAALLGGLVIKPQGKPTLVPVSDKRPELNDAKNDFESVNINN